MYRPRALSGRIDGVCAIVQCNRSPASTRIVRGSTAARADRVRLSELLDQTVRLHRHGEGPLDNGHVERRVSTNECHRFVRGVPAGME
jgi:hypothetical protein